MEKKVLIVDDDPDIQLLLKTILEKEGWETASAENGQRCLDMLEETDPDVILLDFNMPGMDGQEVLGKIKERGLNIPVVVVTAITRDNLPLEFLENGAFDFLSKPIKRSDLIFSTAKAYNYKTLWDRMSAYREKDYNFSELEENLNKMVRGSPGLEMGKFLLLEKQKNFALKDFFSRYLNRRVVLQEYISKINQFMDSLESGDSQEAKRASYGLKNFFENLEISVDETISLLNELRMREEQFKREDEVKRVISYEATKAPRKTEFRE